MNRKSNTRLLAITFTNFLFCLIVLTWLFAPEKEVSAQGPPAAFLGPIYYGSYPVTNVFDHQLPYLSLGIQDPFLCTRHNDGTPCDPNPPDGLGYDTHDGIDYDLNYEIVLAAAGGTVSEAGWSDPTNHMWGLGLCVRVEHDNDYITEYGHLSTVHVRTGDPIVVDPDNRQGIIGISGNTGNSFGSHLHFGLINPDGVRVNPYGWVGPTGQDPWEQDPLGAVSHNVWIDEPSITTAQFPDGDAINDPGVNNARMIIDDASADFTPSALPPCWESIAGNPGYNHGYQFKEANTAFPCFAYWHIKPDAFTPPGDYDLFVHIPPGGSKTLGAEYTIRHNGKSHTAVIVQAAYPNNEHGSWVYIGRYDFAMQTGNQISEKVEFVQLTNQTIVEEADPNAVVTADAIMLAPAANTEDTQPPVDKVYISFAGSGTAGNIPYADEDILAYNAVTGEWSLLFDGSDVGLAASNVDDFDFLEGDIYYSLNRPRNTIGIVPQIYRFSPTSLGVDTDGTSKEFFVHNELNSSTEDVDAFSFGPDGRYLFSTVGTAVTGGGSFDDEDVFAYHPQFNGGQFSRYWDGTAVNLTTEAEDINGLWSAPADDTLYLTTAGAFAIPGSSGDGADIFTCHREGDCDAGLFWNGSAHGLDTATVDGLSLASEPLALCWTFANGGFEQQFRCWAATSDHTHINWLPTTEDVYSDLFSAKGEIDFSIFQPNSSSAHLVSSPFAVQPNTRYRFQFYGRKLGPGTDLEIWLVEASVTWFQNGQPLSFSTPVGYFGWAEYPTEWAIFSSDFVCPPAEADAGKWKFRLSQTSNGAGAPTVEAFIDQVSITTQPGTCPVH